MVHLMFRHVPGISRCVNIPHQEDGIHNIFAIVERVVNNAMDSRLCNGTCKRVSFLVYPGITIVDNP